MSVVVSFVNALHKSNISRLRQHSLSAEQDKTERHQFCVSDGKEAVTVCEQCRVASNTDITVLDRVWGTVGGRKVWAAAV